MSNSLFSDKSFKKFNKLLKIRTTRILQTKMSGFRQNQNRKKICLTYFQMKFTLLRILTIYVNTKIAELTFLRITWQFFLISFCTLIRWPDSALTQQGGLILYIAEFLEFQHIISSAKIDLLNFDFANKYVSNNGKSIQKYVKRLTQLKLVTKIGYKSA